MKNKKFKNSIITERKMELIFFSWLKDSSIFKNKTFSNCKTHTRTGKGSINEKIIFNTGKNCCD